MEHITFGPSVLVRSNPQLWPAFTPSQSTGLLSNTSLGLICLQAGLGSSLPLFLSVFLLKAAQQLGIDAVVTVAHSLKEEVCVDF